MAPLPEMFTNPRRSLETELLLELPDPLVDAVAPSSGARCPRPGPGRPGGPPSSAAEASKSYPSRGHSPDDLHPQGLDLLVEQSHAVGEVIRIPLLVAQPEECDLLVLRGCRWSGSPRTGPIHPAGRPSARSKCPGSAYRISSGPGTMRPPRRADRPHRAQTPCWISSAAFTVLPVVLP